MITLQELVKYLDRYLQVEKYNDFCPNGLQVEGKKEIRKVATGVTASLATIDAALEWGADTLIVHHGLFWDKAPVRLVGPMRERVAKLLSTNTSLLAYHLPLDGHEEVGNNWTAAYDLGMDNLEPFELGVRGTIDPTPVGQWVANIEEYYGQPPRVALGGNDEVETVAIISGGSHRSLPAAAAAGIDFFISGTGDEPNWHTAFEEGIHFAAVGHSASERVGPRAIKKHLQDELALEVEFFDLPNIF